MTAREAVEVGNVDGGTTEQEPQPDWSVIDMHPSLGLLLGRALTLHCPYCGGGHIFESWLTLKERCPRCNTLFEREEGYFVGGYAVNLVVAEFLAFGIVLLLIAFGHFSTLQLQIAGAALALGLPIVFFPASRTVWIAMDLLFHPLGSGD